ncbi:hypothetical protein IHE45_03G043500 [Dioscorea alata]|uniref:Uncharacterized protein n=1 Tax=Dioscorea alata TaxID=55571 RepID=A0ACB7WKG4_DIOAL|nr:hypothetical protein IHE45_03G043500 [Dioscorea alata]
MEGSDHQKGDRQLRLSLRATNKDHSPFRLAADLGAYLDFCSGNISRF